jgi:hypothetical protein
MSDKKVKDTSGIIVSGKVIADIVGVNDRRIRQMVEEGVIDRLKAGSYELIPTLKKYIIHLKTKDDSKNDSPGMIKEIEAGKLGAIKREIAEIQLAQIKSQVHMAEDVERVMVNMLSSFKTKIRSSPVRIAPLIRANMTTNEIADLISKELDQALLELSDYNPIDFQSKKHIDIETQEDD